MITFPSTFFSTKSFNAYNYGTPLLWLDGTDSSAASMTLSGSTITTWKNKGTAAGTDFSAQSGFTSPTLVPDTVGTNSAVLFNGINNVMQSSNLTQTYCPTTSAWTIALLFDGTAFVSGDFYSLASLATGSGMSFPNFGITISNLSGYMDCTIGGEQSGFGGAGNPTQLRFEIPSPTGW